MSTGFKVAACIAALVITSGCAQSSKTFEVSKNDVGQLSLAESTLSPEENLQQQAIALNELTAQLVRQSTVQGATMGAIGGCAAAAIASAGINKCVGSAVVGATVGGLIGRATGKANVKKRVEIVSHNGVGRGLQKAEADLAAMQLDLDDLIEQQSMELLVLAEARKEGRISETEYANRVEAIRQVRAELVEALTLTDKQAKQVHASLQEAQALGQEKLEWHLLASQRLSENSVSAREAVSLF